MVDGIKELLAEDRKISEILLELISGYDKVTFVSNHEQGNKLLRS